MGPPLGPLHLLALAEALADDLVDGRLDKTGADALPRAVALAVVGFPEESEKFCTLDEISLVNNHFQVLPKRAAHMRIGASASHVASTSVNTSQLAGSKNNV
jgi:hypothetical protein